MQKLFGLLVIIGLIWYGLSVYTGDGRGSIDLGSWLDPIGMDSDEPRYSIPDLSGDTDDSPSSSSSSGTQRSSDDSRSRRSVSKPETLPRIMKRKVTDAYQKSYDRVER